jgi:hypothetical protein
MKNEFFNVFIHKYYKERATIVIYFELNLISNIFSKYKKFKKNNIFDVIKLIYDFYINMLEMRYNSFFKRSN